MIGYYIDNFMPKHITRSRKEFDCMSDSLNESTNCLDNDEFGKAATHLENAARSLHELQRMKNERQTFDEAKELLEKAKGVRSNE